MKRFVFVLVVCFSLAVPMRANATDDTASYSIAPVYMDIKGASVVLSRNLGLIRAEIPDPNHRPPYDTSSNGIVYLGVDLATPAGSQLFNDLHRAMRTGVRLTVRCVFGTTHRLIIQQDSSGSVQETFKYWVPELVTFPE